MPEVSWGENIHCADSPAPAPVPATLSMDELRALIHSEMNDAVADVERRLAQARELEQSAIHGTERSIHTEDLNISKHFIDGYTLTANSPAAGSIAWASLHIVFEGVDYTIADGNTANKYAWFIKPGSGTTATLGTGNAVPALGTKDALVFINNGGVPALPDAGVSYAVGTGVIGDAQISGGIAQSKITNLSTTLSTINSDISRVEAKADGAITQHFGPDFPWANGSVQDAAKTGDVYTAQNTTDTANRPNGRSWKWSGPAPASPANTWILIEDSDLTKALADSAAAKQLAEGKTTVYYRTVAQGAPTPLAPATAFAVGDEWVQTDNGNYTQRWTGSAWSPALVGDANLASGISGSKIGTGIDGSNITTGTVSGTRIGTGINGSYITSGTVPVAQVPTLSPTKLNTAFHMLY